MQFMGTILISRACLNQHLIAIRSPRRSCAIRYKPDHDHLHCWSQSSAVQTRTDDWPGIWQLQLIAQWCTLHGGEDWSCHQQPVVLCAGRSRGACIHGTVVGSCREEELTCIILPDGKSLIAISRYNVTIIDHFARRSSQALLIRHNIYMIIFKFNLIKARVRVSLGSWLRDTVGVFVYYYTVQLNLYMIIEPVHLLPEVFSVIVIS